MTRIAQAITRLFQRHRIVFWYDVKEELRQEFEAVTLPGVEKIVLDNNAFGVKVRILREQPEQSFLLYHEGPPPDDLDNWLLDVQLAYGQFRADRVSLWLNEVGLGLEFTDTIAPHTEFFQAVRRREALKEMLEPDDTPRQVRVKMLAVCARSEPRFDEIIENLLDALAANRDDTMRLIRRSNLEDFLWEQLTRTYGYVSETPGLRDFAITLFKSCYAMGVEEAHDLNADAVVFLKRWKDSVSHHQAFETLSAECADILNIQEDLQGRKYTDLIALDTFELIDQKILSDLVRAVTTRTIPGNEVDRLLRRRRQSYWYDCYQYEYNAIGEASALMEALDRTDLSSSAFDGASPGTIIEQYTHLWYRVDQHYRKFIYHARQSGQATLLDSLSQEIENLYTNTYLLQLNNQWQAVIDRRDRWWDRSVLSQRQIFERFVKPFLERNNKIFVVISDGMRYEIGEELLRLIRQEDRYDAELEHAQTLLPSETQLGMAAILPHDRLEMTPDGRTVRIDGESSLGTANRAKILVNVPSGRGTALLAPDLMGMDRDESRALIRDHDVVYVYHNFIDKTGDDRDSEERVFDAAEETLAELVRIVKKLVNANANNLLITADHGFIYQHQPLDESDFAGQEPAGRKITKSHRRYVLGEGLRETSSFKHFTGAEVGIDSQIEILIPKSINRLRIRGAGSRYVHGGATLQETIVPVLWINKKRESDVSQVSVDILRGTSSIITSGQVSVAFYQSGPVTEKVQPRHVRAGIYTQDGILISDQHDLRFDIESENPRERERAVRFILTKEAEEANGQEVILRLEEPVEGTSHYREYKTARYILRRAFTSDFDF
jgi:uncharacterized protein (TIGR02687 family)